MTCKRQLNTFALACLAISTLASVGWPAAADAPPQSMAAMRFLLGTWTCSVKAIDGSTPQVTAITSLSSDGTHMLSKTIAGGDGTTDMWLDSGKQQWVQTAKSSKGSTSQTSAGFSGTTMVWVGTITASGMPTMNYRTTLIKVSDTKTQQTDELGAPGSSTWLGADTATCVKVR
ncbi:MAG: hypothetical protein JO293_03165 [Candidatus Eremiobacteraeota bacterium]|nr:hypothetical protein [Candidatus Eremiobacteraeota bacterium]